MRTLATLASSALMLSVLNGCRDPLDAFADPALQVEREHQAVRLRNISSAAIHYFIVECNTTALISWAPCVLPSCPAVPARAAVTIPDSAVLGYSPDARQAIVYWWRAISDENGGRRPGPVRRVLISFGN